jgi:saccharopine dehydrogenase-like NADP-dependent oxidoreductase
MKKILVIGTGLSASSLIKFLLDNAEKNAWQVVVGDLSQELAREKVGGHPSGKAVPFDARDAEARRSRIEKSDIVISLLPAHLHTMVAEDCVELRKDLVTPSYASDEMKSLDGKAREAGVLLMNEVGVDPGLDHMSAMRTIDMIREKGGVLSSFRSFTGGLIAPESDDNPWNYKFTWNPVNVIRAGRGTAQFIENGQRKYVPYQRLFERVERVSVDGFGEFEGYPNRDSLMYRALYGLDEIPTLFRGTLRRKGFCRSWNVFVQLGMTDDSFVIEDSREMTYRQFLDALLPESGSKSVEERFCRVIGVERDSPEMKKFEWLGLFEEKGIRIEGGTPAQILQELLEEKWRLAPADKDMIVMRHEFDYGLDGKRFRIHSSLVVIGGERPYTAMSDTVGLPLGIVGKLILDGTIREKGVHIPISKSIYAPALDELEQYGIIFEEKEDIHPTATIPANR